MPPLRVAVLECDTPLDRTRAKYGGYGGVFRALLESGAEALAKEKGNTKPVDLEITKFRVETEEIYPNLDDIDAVLLTGSRKYPRSQDFGSACFDFGFRKSTETDELEIGHTIAYWLIC